MRPVSLVSSACSFWIVEIKLKSADLSSELKPDKKGWAGDCPKSPALVVTHSKIEGESTAVDTTRRIPTSGCRIIAKHFRNACRTQNRKSYYF
jgi:hypothetical protein